MSKSFSRVLIKDKNHRLLMVQDRKGEWNFPGGKLEKGESLLQCAIREVKEEVNVQVTNLIELYEDVFIFNDVHWNGLFISQNPQTAFQQ
ncbi:NUDIX hydrolase [Piscibacillus salipiscarius]|uniref:NUDIX hydrolase n=1 Tax=Piscibacillus salipiscarius TaxID=299480 RepID=UPI0006CF495D|nr:NUDIX hydrolase [Piscibacillus salipiscarius]